MNVFIKKATAFTGMGLLAFGIFVGLCLLQLAVVCLLAGGLVWAAGAMGVTIPFWPAVAIVFVLSILLGGR